MTGPDRPVVDAGAAPDDLAARRAAERAARLEALLRVDVGPVPARGGDEGDDPVPVVAPGPARSAPPDDPADAGDPVLPAPSPAPAAAPGWRRPGTAQVVSALVLVVLLVAGGVLVWAGVDLLRSSTEGELVVPLRDPTAPGYEALIDPTPTLAVLHDLDGEVDAITVLTLPDPADGGGGVVYVPTRVVVEIPVLGRTPLEAGYDLGSPAVQAEAVGDLLGAAVGEVAVVDAERWAGLVAPVAPIEVDNPDAIEVDGEVVFPVGTIALGPDDVGPYLEARLPGESDLARLFRHRALWEAWLRAVADAGGGDAVPGELEAGIGRFVRQLASGSVEHDQLPVRESPVGGDGTGPFGEEPTFRPDRDAIDALVARLVPFPRSPRPGVRPRVRVLNGTPDVAAAAAVAPLLPPAGVEVVLVGNAPSLDVATTTVAYVDPEHRDEARALAELLGVGEVVVDERPGDAADITVTLGADHD